MSDERERGRVSAWSAVTGTGGSDLLSVRPQPGLTAPNPQTPVPSGEKHNLNCLHEKGGGIVVGRLESEAALSHMLLALSMRGGAESPGSELTSA
ncbi:hypothetical protein G5714_023737 [Onychostoma macrolepis]|uniref:Uncharacterized protein n=1 Tax=Onychostoma macrolepis TaxID=369639 RepID=A0A7J6BMD3_9TELE|nr:hypothetical protein G5714_023737 [Onychostoma macrolepis]